MFCQSTLDNVVVSGNTVKGDATDEQIVAWDADLLDIPTADAVRGNITLPDTGDMNSTITWESSDENVIRTTANGNILPGQVTRQKEDTKVTLTATLTKGEASTTKEFDCTVIKEAEDVELTDYLFAYLIHTSYVPQKAINSI